MTRKFWQLVFVFAIVIATLGWLYLIGWIAWKAISSSLISLIGSDWVAALCVEHPNFT
jgi:hypothetical protein